MAELLDDVLISLRRILRATSMHSRKLGKSVGISAPQLMVMRAIDGQQSLTGSEIAKAVSLSQATVTNIVIKLEASGLLLRNRSELDRRRVDVTLTEAGRQVLSDAPKPLQESFARKFAELPRWEQYQLVSSLERVAMMMDAEDLDAAPLLSHTPDIE
ncbi:MAG: MarR family transcriptional regulator [Congregibacter sp.]